ncbi:MAG TPA: PaaI family thioesterase [Rhizobiaceae bacterium]|nr:PaaI family thioesterase [Rhizobiaceae bacterium]
MDEISPVERFFTSHHPANATLKIRYRGFADGVLSVELEATPEFVADEATGALHSGFATLALDTVMGGAVLGSLDKIQPFATAGLTSQHMRRPVSGERLVCRARCEGVHSDIAHMSGQLVSAQSGEVLSTATGTFMIGTRAKPLGSRV